MNVERILRSLLATALVLGLLAAVGCESAPTGNASSQQSAAADVSSETPSSETLSSEEAVSQEASQEVSSQEKLPLRDERGYVIVRNMLDELDLSFNGDTSACFPADAAGYIVEGGPYPVDADTLRRLTTAKVEGSGTVKWIGYKELHSVSSQKDCFTGEVPSNRFNDPLYMATCLPSEVKTFLSSRVNAENMFPSNAKYRNIMTIGGIYRNEENPPAEDDTVTICIKDIRLILHTAEKGWFVASNAAVPDLSMVNHIYYLPWGNSSYPLNSSQLKVVDDHVEISLTGADFSGARGKEKNGEIKASLLHFWGEGLLPSRLGNITYDQIDGLVASYTVWIKEENMVGHFAATIGADWRVTAGGATDQAFSGYNYLVTTQPRVVFGHTVGPNAYDTLMDSEAVRAMLGL